MNYDPNSPGDFISGIDRWIAEGGKFPDFAYYDVTTIAEAQAVIRAVEKGDLDWSEPPSHTPNIHPIAFLLQSDNPEIRTYFRDHAAASLRSKIAEKLEGEGPIKASRREWYAYEKSADGYLFALQALIRFGFDEDGTLLVKAARKTGFNDQYFWSSIFGHAERNLPRPETVLEDLKDPLPEKFCKIAYLDFANSLCFDNRASHHPFDTDEGFEFLLQLIEQNDQGYDSYVKSAVQASPFLSKARSDVIIQAVSQHGFKHIRHEADWAKARIGGADGIGYLFDQFRTVQFHSRASDYLSALGVTPPGFEETETAQFKALVAYSDWMANEQDFCGYPPENIEILDLVDVVWPAADNRVPFWRVAYDTQDLFADDESSEARIQGVSIVSLVGFVRFFDEDDKQYAYSAAVTFDESYKALTPKWPDQEWCTNRLEALNPKLFGKGSS